MCTLNSQAVSACVSTSPKDFLQIHSTSHLMRFRVAYGSHRQKNKHNTNAKWFNLHREHTRILSHGVAVQRTLKILFAFSCNNQPSLALKLTPTPPPPPHISSSLIDSGWTLSGFPSSNENCKSFSFVLLCEQLSAATYFFCF